MAGRLQIPFVAVAAAVIAIVPSAAAYAEPALSAGSTDADADWSVEQVERILRDQPGDLVQVSDMLFPRSVLQGHRDQLAGTATDAEEKAATTSVARWPGGNVYYTFDPIVSSAHRVHFLDAATEWATFANLRFVARTTQANYVTVKDVAGLTGGNSSVGMIGGQQFLNIGSTWWNRYTLLHEIGHTLGLVHEHQRNDRGTYVTILTANIVPGREADFVSLPSTNFGTYDHLSVMHYARNTASIDPATKNTIVPTSAYSGYLNSMGNQYDRPLSTPDRAGMGAAYGSPTVPPGAVVSNTNDSGPGSLRAAISYAFDRSEASASVTTVTFAIPTTDPGFAGGVATIRPTGALPALGNRTLVDGTSQTAAQGDTNPNGPEVAINGGKIVAAEQYTPGFVLKGTGSTVKGLIINGFNSDGVRIDGWAATANVVTGCHIGTDASGTTAAPNASAGVWVTGGAHDNRIGGLTVGDRNVISGNGGRGISISGALTNTNLVQGNFIGLGATGAALANNVGIAVYGGARSNTIGGTAAGARNVISGNVGSGMNVVDAGTTLNVVAGNFIGTDPAGTSPRANTGAGISILGGAQSNTIGGSMAAARNIVSGNSGRGVAISGSGTNANQVQGNFIGLGATGAAIANNVGTSVFGGAQSNSVGGTAPGTGNVISGNTSQGVNIGDAGTTLNVVAGNLIGLDPGGTAARANTGAGIAIFGGAQSNTIGGTTAGGANTISGNTENGLGISDAGTSGNKVEGNRIGLNAAGWGAVANGWNGVQVFGKATDNTIGGTAAGARNSVSGNGNYGVALSDAGTSGNLVHGNTIGKTASGSGAPNGWGGVGVWGGAQSNQVGGTSAGTGNVITGNSSHGVLVMDAATTGNAIRGNAVWANAGLGINLAGGVQHSHGVTSNDTGDAETGPNSLQNYPVLTSATNGTTLVVQGTLSSTANTTYRVELFSGPTADPSTYGEGGTYLGFVNVTTGSGGTSPAFTFTATTTVPTGHVITATATDPAGNTSEFSLRRLVS